jgi:bla regulator protein BlaR1
METSLLNQWLSGGEVKAICWTLIHSLWIGMIIALLAGLVIMLTRKSAAALRYRLLCGILVLFVLAVSVIFYIEVSTTGAIQTNPNNVKLFINPVSINIADHGFTTPRVSPVKVVVNFLDSYINIIFIVWLLFFIMKSLKMMSGLLYIQRIRTYKVHAVAEEFKLKIELFSSQIGIRQTIRLVQSELVKVPVAVGWLKPVILLPIGIILQLTPEQLDSILWHELAHIRRRDYLVNILQGLVETVFFFNPGLLWLSSLIRAEREACCDDLVLSQMNKKANYLEALLSFGFGEYKQARLAMGIGSGNQLRDRLKRMVSQENKRLSIAEKLVLCVGLVLVSAFSTISKDNPIVKRLHIKFTPPSGKVTQKTMTVSMHILPKGQRVNDRTPQSRDKNTIIVTDTSLRFTSVLFKNSDADIANNDISAMDANGKKYHFIVADDKLVGMEIDGAKVAEKDLPGYQYMITYIDRTLAEKRRVRYEDIAAYKANSPAPKFKKGNPGNFDKRPNGSNGRKIDSVSARRYSDQNYDNWHGPDPRYMKDEAMVKRQREDSIGYSKELQRMHNIITDLIKDKVVANVADVKWFGLSNTEFIVNGQKLSDEMQQRYKAKYGVSDGNGLYYGPVQMYGRGVFIDENADALRPSGLPRLNRKAMLNGSDTFNSEWDKQQQLIKQQQRFAQEQGKYREQLIKQQQAFAEEQNKNRGQIIKQQQVFVAEQDKKRQQIIKQQQALLDDQAKTREQWKERNDRLFQSKIALPEIVSNVANDLISENIVKDKSDLYFNLTNTFLMVNGVKQSDEIHEKFKEKYLVQSKCASLNQQIISDPNFGLHYDAKNNGMGIGINVDAPPDSKAVK